MKALNFALGLTLVLGCGSPLFAQSPSAKTAWWSADVEQALGRAAANRPEIARALEMVPTDSRKGMAFLVVNMPEKDLRTLKADFLLENVDLAYKARQQTPWGDKIPEEVFLNDVLPYANVDESRHPWRKEMFDLCMPIIKDCKTPAEAAQKLNSTVFVKLQVKYSTERKKAQQSPKESIEQGKASCTGLSIMLADACRSVCVPARLVGTPMWSNLRGNHTWVEIWDRTWHYTGACEPDPNGLDRGWFVGDAAQAKEDSRQHAIYAASFQKTATTFPLNWAPRNNDVFAENVTARYAKPKDVAAGTRVMIRVRLEGKKERLMLPVEVVDKQDPKKVFEGKSRGETADANDFLSIDLPAGREYLLRVGQPVQLEMAFKTTGDKEQLVDVEVPQAKPSAPGKSESAGEKLPQIEAAAKAFFAASPAKQSTWKFDTALDQYLAGHEEAVRAAVWVAYKSAPIHAVMKENYDKNEVTYQQHRSPFTVKKVGARPKNGWPLFIAMHGGGGVAKSVNDSQWKQMQKYYRDQPDAGGYLYLALRAPNDTWNGFYDEYVPPLISNLIREFLLFGDVDSDKVFLMGYSHGGYGAFYIGPKIPDHFAAVHCSASAPTDGAISAKTLRNTRFTFMVGENDTMYGRKERCEKFDAEMQALKQQNPGDYPVAFQLMKGFGHGGLPDKDKIKEMIPFTRNPVPKHVSWVMTDAVVKHFFWLGATEPKNGSSVDVAIRDNEVEIATIKVDRLDLMLDGRLVALDKPLRIRCNGKTEEVRLQPQLLTFCRSLMVRGDPALAFSCQVSVNGAR
jgi:predicted esterase